MSNIVIGLEGLTKLKFGIVTNQMLVYGHFMKAFYLLQLHIPY